MPASTFEIGSPFKGSQVANDPTPILELMDGFRRSKTLFAAVKLGIFDGARPRGVATGRLLEACVGLRLLEKRGSDFVNTSLADQYLRSDRPESLAGYARSAGSSLYERWGHLEQAVIEGTVKERPDREPAPEAYRDFVAGMHAFGLISSPRVAAAFDLSPFRKFVDLGGCTGHLALAIQKRYPEMKVGVLDVPQVIQVARKYIGDQAEIFAGDFFAGPLPAADLYGLGKVLHNHTEPNIHLLLRRIHSALPEGGGLLIAERLLDEDRGGPLHVHLSSLNMLVAGGGIERTFSEYRALLDAAGFKAIRHQKTGMLVDAIFAEK
jgi:acetylserotonin N-methyltransferase